MAYRTGPTRFLGSLAWWVGPALLFLAGAAGFRAAAQASPDPRYYRYDQITALFQAWQQQYPDLIHVESIGLTGTGGEPIRAARISDHANVHENEPVLLLHGAQHANEPNGTNAILYLMERLLAGYGHDPQLTTMIDSLEMWFIPILNVDGHRMAFAEGPEALHWRKNKRDNDGNGQATWPQDGVDLNRNWDYHWVADDSTNPASEYYKGPWPFSEAEIVALRSFVLRQRPLILMDYHSPYQQSPGNQIYFPWMGSSAPDYEIYHSVASGLASRTETEHDGQHYSVLPCFNTLPKEQNWIYANTEICVLLMEITEDNFWQGAMVDTIAARTGRGSLYLMERALQGPGVRGHVTDAVTGAPLTAEVRVEEVSGAGIGPYMTEGQYGGYWRFLSHGTYTVTAHAAGHLDRTESVAVGSSGWTTLDLALSPAGSSVGDPAEDGGPDGRDHRPSPGGAAARVALSENPLRPGARIRLEGAAGPILLSDLSGRVLRRIEGNGDRAVTWDGRDDAGRLVPDGTYFLRIPGARPGTPARIVLLRRR